jgi:hypothetical protein
MRFVGHKGIRRHTVKNEYDKEKALVEYVVIRVIISAHEFLTENPCNNG